MAESKQKPAIASSIEKQTGFRLRSAGADAGWTLTNDKYDIVADKPASFIALEARKNLGNTAVSEVIAKSKQYGEMPILLVADYVSFTQAEKLRAANVQFVDAAGNAFVRNASYLIFISGQKPENRPKKSIAAFSPAGIELLLAFVNRPELINADYRTIAGETRVTHTTVGRWFGEMERLGFLRRRRTGERRLLRRDELLSRWTNYYGETFRNKLEPVRFKSTKKTGRWWDEIDVGEFGAVWGGETGGERLTRHLKPAQATIYSNSLLPKLQFKYRLVRDPSGEFEIVKKFWKFGDLGDVAPPLVVYADLMATGDERNIETARLIYDEYLAEDNQAVA